MSKPRSSQRGSGNGNSSGIPVFTTQSFPASRKVYVKGAQPGVRVPMREISLTPTRAAN
ncbi:MAG: hypothetical protein AAB093_01335, partial [Nitrospirota bacterium]